MLLIVEVLSHSNVHPDFAAVEITPKFLETLNRLRKICLDNALVEVQSYDSPQAWDSESVFNLRGDTLHVDFTESFYFTCWDKHTEQKAWTRFVPIDSVASLLEKGSAPDIDIQGDTAYYPKEFRN